MTLGEFRKLTADLPDSVEIAIATDVEVNRICPLSGEPWVETFPDQVERLCIAPDTHDASFENMDWSSREVHTEDLPGAE